MTVLEAIFAHKREEVARRQQEFPLAAVQAAAARAAAPLDFCAALRTARQKPALIAEVKFASPSRGILLAGTDPAGLARCYAENGAAAISVLTDEKYFCGRLDYLRRIRAALPGTPLLRKDFICDPYQVYEARAAGADAVLLIVAGLAADQLCDLHALALDLGMAALVEVHNAAESDLALACQPSLVGVNNRDLRDFSVSLETTLSLRPQLPPQVAVVAESGIHTPADIARLQDANVHAILVGEALVTATDVAAKVREMSGMVTA
jgi:indole-3-glycerol phosphate synthase